MTTRVVRQVSDSCGETFFGEPVMWRAEAAEALGIGVDDLPAAISPGAAFPAVLRTIVHSMPSPRTIVDVGSGGGGASEYLRRETGATVWAVEPSSLARHTASRCFPLLRQVVGDALQTGLPSGCADAVMMCGVLSLIDQPHGAIDEAARLLAAGGHLAIADLFATGRADLRSAPNVFRTLETVSDGCAEHGLVSSEVAVGEATLDSRWATIAARVDAWIDKNCCDRDGYEAWSRDQHHLQRHIANGDVLGGCVIAHRP